MNDQQPTADLCLRSGAWLQLRRSRGRLPPRLRRRPPQPVPNSPSRRAVIRQGLRRWPRQKRAAIGVPRCAQCRPWAPPTRIGIRHLPPITAAVKRVASTSAPRSPIPAEISALAVAARLARWGRCEASAIAARLWAGDHHRGPDGNERSRAPGPFGSQQTHGGHLEGAFRLRTAPRSGPCR